jgi:hypothetical protein
VIQRLNLERPMLIEITTLEVELGPMPRTAQSVRCSLIGAAGLERPAMLRIIPVGRIVESEKYRVGLGPGSRLGTVDRTMG